MSTFNSLKDINGACRITKVKTSSMFRVHTTNGGMFSGLQFMPACFP